MAKITKKIIKDIIKENNGVKTVNWNGININIKKRIEFSEIVSLSRAIAGACFDNGKYTPELRDVLVQSSIVVMYSNIELPDDMNERYHILFTGKLFQTIIEYIDMSQFKLLNDYIDERVEFEKSVMHEQVNKIINSVDVIVENINKITNDITSGVNIDELKSLLSSLSNMNINEEKIINSILNAKEK